MIRKFLPLIIIILVLSLIVFYRFPVLPKNLAYDEVQFAKLALSLEGKPYIPYSPLATGHATLYFYLILFSFKLFGVTNFALRFPAALFGILSPVVLYFIFYKIFKKYPTPYPLPPTFFCLLLALVFATSRWYFNFARFGFEATFLIFLELMSLFFIVSVIPSAVEGSLSKASSKTLTQGILRLPASWWVAQNNKYVIMSGVFSGFAYNSYTPGRIFFILPLIYLLIYFRKKIFYFLIPFVIVILPLTVYLVQHPDTRVDQQFFLKNTEMTITQKAEFLGRNISSVVLMFDVKGDVNGRHNYPYKPALNPLIGILFIIGLLIALKNWRQKHHLLFLTYFFLSLIPAVLTYPWENPNMLRTVTAIPAIVYFTGITAITIIAKYKKWKNLLLIVFVGLLIVSSFYEIRTYFLYQSRVFPDAFEVKYDLPTALKLKI